MHSQPQKRADRSQPPIGPRAADITLAGLGLCGSISLLGVLEPLVGQPLFVGPMMASGIIFFAGPTPPDPKGFISGTICSATLSYGALYLLSNVLPPIAAQGAAAGTLLMWYKATGAIFPPAAVLAGLLTTASVSSSAPGFLELGNSLGFLVCPWLAGHAALYACAYAMGLVRAAARVALTKQQLRGGALSDEQLRETFHKFDTSGDGALDANELKIALRVVVGADLPIGDCEALVAAADKNGDGTVDFDEFRAICSQQL